MKTKNLLKTLLLFLLITSLAGCQKEEFDFDSEETDQSTVVEGVFITSEGLPIANVEVNVDYCESKWLAYSKTTHKATTKTDKNGKYRLFFSIKDNEVKTEKDKELGINKDYSLVFNLKQLNPDDYIIPNDLTSIITSVYPPIGSSKEGDEIETTINYYPDFERGTTYTMNHYIPQKRYVEITLSGFIPKQDDFFEIRSSFAYGLEGVTNNLFQDTNYGSKTTGDYLFALYDAQERTYQIPCAVNANNIITLIRKKDGVYSTEEHNIFISKDTPEKLNFEY